MGRTRYYGLSCGVLVVRSAITVPNGGASHGWITHPPIHSNVFVVLGSPKGAKLGVTIFLVLARPKFPPARAGCVVVGWRWAIALLPLVRAGEGNLKGSRDQEEEPGASVLDSAPKGPGD